MFLKSTSTSYQNVTVVVKTCSSICPTSYDIINYTCCTSNCVTGIDRNNSPSFKPYKFLASFLPLLGLFFMK